MAVALIDRSGRRWPAMWRARCGRISQQIAALAPLLTSPHVYAQPMPLPMPITYNQALFTGRDTITTLLARAVTPLTVFTVSAHSPLDAAARGCAVTCTAASPTTAIAARAQTSPHSRALGDFPLSLPAPPVLCFAKSQTPHASTTRCYTKTISLVAFDYTLYHSCENTCAVILQSFKSLGTT